MDTENNVEKIYNGTHQQVKTWFFEKTRINKSVK